MENSSTRGRRWVNQYIEKVASRGDRILASRPHQEDPEFDSRLKGLLASNRSIIVEIGSGSGEHLIERAAMDPSTLFIGVELRFKRIFRMIEKAEARGLDNLFGLHTDAQKISPLFDGYPLKGIYLLFPEPWSKKRRWRKHRLAQTQWLKQMSDMLAEDGFFSFKTDQIEYFDEVVEALRGIPSMIVLEQSRNFHSEPYAAKNIPSEFEKLFKSQGLPVAYLRAIKRLTKL